MHRGRNRDSAKYVPSWDTYSRLELACRNAVRDLAAGVKQQQEKINGFLSELEVAKREPKDPLIQGDARET